MTVLPEVRFLIAPNFHLDIDWRTRLLLGARVERTAQGPVVHPPWRPADAEQLAMLVLDPTQGTAPEELAACLCLFVVPVHLRLAFWNLAAQAQEQGTIPPDGFSAFAAEVARFLAFKELPLPAGAVCELVVIPPQQTATLATTSLWGLINLGEDAASVVLLKEPAQQDSAREALPVRFQFEPGEGVRIPAGVLLASVPVEKEQSEVWLVIRLPAETPPSSG
jgi:hypothetical protein